MSIEKILTEINKKQEEISRLIKKMGIKKLDGFVGNTWMTIETFKPVKPKKQGIRLEQGRFYRTKGGRKVYIATDDKHFCYGIIEDNKVATTYERNGYVHYNKNEPVYPRDDIVAEWK